MAGRRDSRTNHSSHGTRWTINLLCSRTVTVDCWAVRRLAVTGASGFLVDSHEEGGAGGSGRAFDWSTIPTGLGKPFILAGGLDPDNVFDAIQATLPWGVDVASGIETAPGVKDGDKMRRFVEEVRRADCHSD